MVLQEIQEWRGELVPLREGQDLQVRKIVEPDQAVLGPEGGEQGRREGKPELIAPDTRRGVEVFETHERAHVIDAPAVSQPLGHGLTPERQQSAHDGRSYLPEVHVSSPVRTFISPAIG